MNLIKEDVHASLLKATKYSQITIDEDFNISESKGDIEKVIAKIGNVYIDEIISQENRVKLIGEVRFSVLYKSSEANHGVEVYSGQIGFEDTVNVDGIAKTDYVECRSKIEDLAVSVINSRKISIRGLIGNALAVYESKVYSVAKDIENPSGIECQYIKPVITESVILKHDIAKIREDVVIPNNKPNIDEIIWSSVDTRNMEIKAMEDKLSIRGELEMFVMYRGKEEHLPIQNIFCVRGIAIEIDCVGAREDMILDADFSLGKGDVIIRQDEDGEDRIIGVEYSLDMNLKLYEDKPMTMLCDLYSPQIDFARDMTKFSYENIILRNQAKIKLYSRKSIAVEDGRIMQLLFAYGNVMVENTETNDEGVVIEGVARICILYVAQNEEPLNCEEIDIPFSYQVESGILESDISIRVVPCLDHLVGNLISADEIEIKGQISLGISIFRRVDTNIISEVTISEIDYEKKAAVPGIIGYIVKDGDTLWSIARQYYATTESIKNINNLENNDIFPGDKLIIVKE